MWLFWCVYGCESSDYCYRSRQYNDPYDKKLTLKNNAPFVSCISKINNTLIDNAEDLDVVMPMYNLLEYTKNYRKTTGSFGITTKMNQTKNQQVVVMVQ